jgi:hypothetical protein
MQNGLAAMEVALRVLMAINQKRQPNPADLEELHRLAPLLADLPADELACDVIKQALQRRESVRKAASC